MTKLLKIFSTTFFSSIVPRQSQHNRTPLKTDQSITDFTAVYRIVSRIRNIVARVSTSVRRNRLLRTRNRRRYYKYCFGEPLSDTVSEIGRFIHAGKRTALMHDSTTAHAQQDMLTPPVTFTLPQPVGAYPGKVHSRSGAYPGIVLWGVFVLCLYVTLRPFTWFRKFGT